MIRVMLKTNNEQESLFNLIWFEHENVKPQMNIMHTASRSKKPHVIIKFERGLFQRKIL